MALSLHYVFRYRRPKTLWHGKTPLNAVNFRGVKMNYADNLPQLRYANNCALMYCGLGERIPARFEKNDRFIN
jgi:hypothetical protein